MDSRRAPATGDWLIGRDRHAEAAERIYAAAAELMSRNGYDGFTIDAEEGRLDVNVTVEELSRRKKDWKPREHGYGAGALWKYAQQVGPAMGGAVTHPGGSHEGVCYADI